MARRVQRGDLVSASRALRQLLTALDTAAFALKGDYAPLGKDIESALARARKPIDLLSERLYKAIETLEQSEPYQDALVSSRDTQ
jgi:hypothetical protein